MQNKNLIDINSIDINASLPTDEKLKIYINKVKNPYQFFVDDVMVKVSFRGKDRLSQETIQNLITKVQ